MNNIKALFRITGQLNYILTTRQKKEAVTVFFTMVLCSVLELLGVSVIYPFLQLMMDTDNIRSKWYLKWLFDLFTDISFNDVLVFMCIGIIAVYLIKNAVTLLCVYKQNKYATSFQRELSTDMLRFFMKRPYEYFVNTNSANIRQSILGDTSSTYNVLLNLFQLAAECLTILMIGLYLLYTDWIVAIAAFVLAVACFLAIVLSFKKRLKKAGNDMTVASIGTTKSLTEAIEGIKEIIVADRRECFVRLYENSSREVERVTLLYNFLSACPDRILEGVCIGGFIGIACVRIVLGGNPAQFVPVLGAFAMGAFKILPSMSKVSSRINSIVYEQTRLARCYNDLKEIREYEDETQQFISPLDNPQDKAGRLRFTEKICIRNLKWKYRNSPVNVLEGLDLTIRKGEAVALIGASGAGKTTLADIILGLFRPQSGGVYMDGIDVATIPHTWASIVGYVPQSVYLIDDTIRGNVAFGLREDQTDDDRVWMALKEAQLYDYVTNLPQGLDTIVGERGVKFSGGQRQRIAIARALYDNPEILVLDEATSALDTETEAAVMESVEALLGRKTMIIIAHRLTTIRNCDKIYEIADGKAVERKKSDVI